MAVLRIRLFDELDHARDPAFDFYDETGGLRILERKSVCRPAPPAGNLRSPVDPGQFPGVIGATGKSIVPFPIPNNPGLIGITVYSQAVLYNAGLKRWMATNAFAMSAGK